MAALDDSRRFLRCPLCRFGWFDSTDWNTRATEAKDAEIARLKEDCAVLKSQVENADVNLEQVRLVWRGQATKLEADRDRLAAELAKKDGELSDLLGDSLTTEGKLRAELESARQALQYIQDIGWTAHAAEKVRAALAHITEPAKRCTCNDKLGSMSSCPIHGLSAQTKKEGEPCAESAPASNTPTPNASNTDGRLAASSASGQSDPAPLADSSSRFTAPIVCICGSTKFKQAWISENARLTREGNIVLAVGLWGHHERVYPSPEEKLKLDETHKRKIDLCDWVWVMDIGRYIGESTRSEIEYAKKLGKPVRYLSLEFPGYVEPEDAMAAELAQLRQQLADVTAERDELNAWRLESQDTPEAAMKLVDSLCSELSQLRQQLATVTGKFHRGDALLARAEWAEGWRDEWFRVANRVQSQLFAERAAHAQTKAELPSATRAELYAERDAHYRACSERDALRARAELAEKERDQYRKANWMDELDRLQRENAEFRDKLSRMPANWMEDSSLETWFPLTANDIKETKTQLLQAQAACESMRRASNCAASTLQNIGRDADASMLLSASRTTPADALREFAEKAFTEGHSCGAAGKLGAPKAFLKSVTFRELTKGAQP